MDIRISTWRVSVVVCVATLLLVPALAIAGSCGRGFCYGGFVEAAVSSSSNYVSNVPPLLGRERPADPPRIVNCQRHQETIAVPVEGGGEQQVRITRC